MSNQAPAQIMTNSQALGTLSSGMREELMRANMDPQVLRVHGPLQDKEWIAIDQTVVQIARARLNVARDMIGRGLVKRISNPLGRTEYEWETESDISDALVAMSPTAQAEKDLTERVVNKLPLYLTFKDFSIGIRTLLASRNLNDGLDTTMPELCARKVADKIEDSIVNGPDIKVAGNTAYGFTNHPSRNTYGFKDSLAWTNTAKTGVDIMYDVQQMLSALHTDKFFGPYVMYVPSTYWSWMVQDYSAQYGKSLYTRLREIPGLGGFVNGRPTDTGDVKVSDVLADNNVVIVEMTTQSVDLLMGDLTGTPEAPIPDGSFSITTVNWDGPGGFDWNFKTMAMVVPRIKVTQTGQSGVVHGAPTEPS
jgi:uncharacterized linocin/CFP29 family protein